MSASSEAEGAGGLSSPEKIEHEATAQAAESEALTSDVPSVHKSTGYGVPRSTAEAQLAAIWAEVLRVDEVGVHDDFFALGGDSIRAVRVTAMAQNAGIRVTTYQLFEHPTIAGLAAAITEQEAASEVHEPRAEFLTDQAGSTARDELGISDLHAANEISMERIEGYLRALQAGLSRIESKFDTLAS